MKISIAIQPLVFLMTTHTLSGQDIPDRVREKCIAVGRKIICL